jgi:predicted MFS family arabinose efflux permease
VVSSVFANYASRWEPFKTMLVSAFLGSGLLLILLPMLSYPFVLAALFALGICQAMPNLVALTLTQMIVPSRLLGRFFGLLNVATTTCYVTGMLLGGLVATWSIKWMYRGTGIVSLAVFCVFVLYRKRFQGGAESHAQHSAKYGGQ